MTTLIHKDLSYAVRGDLFDVYNKLGPMLPEQFYQDALAFRFGTKGIACQTEKGFKVFYRGQQVGLYYVDLWIEGGKIILELKVVPEILPLHQAQALSYLKVTDADLAFVVNYGAGSLMIERLPNFLRDKVVDFEWEQRPPTEGGLYPELADRVLKALHRVHFELGPGFLHQAYRRATMIELAHQGLNYQYLKKLPVYYDDHFLGEQEVRLIWVDEKLLVATVAVKRVEERLQEHMKARLRHLGLHLGLLANFNDTSLQVIFVRRQS